MATKIHVPKWGMTMEDAIVVAWLKKVGDTVEAGEPLVELETDKITGEVESPATGVLSEVLVDEGAEVVVGDVIGMVEEQ